MKLFDDIIDIIDILDTIYANPHARKWVNSAAVGLTVFFLLIALDTGNMCTPLRYLPDTGKKIISFPGSAKAI